MSIPTILIVDDSAPVRLWLRKLLEAQFRSLEAEDCSTALCILETEKVDLVLLDYALPQDTGLDFCRQIRSHPKLKDLPVVMVTTDPKDQLISDAFQAGVTDYLRKPLKPVELLARLSQALKNKAIREQAAALIQELKERSERDPLTCLYNRATLQQLAASEIAKARRAQGPLGLLILDVDHFKLLNDRFGHLVGDSILAHVASFLVAHLRQYDLVTRFGGDEFVVLLPNTALAQTQAVGEKLRAALEQHPFPGEQAPIHLTLSIGAASLEPPNHDITSTHAEVFLALLHDADKALYHAKQCGRNQVATALSTSSEIQGA